MPYPQMVQRFLDEQADPYPEDWERELAMGAVDPVVDETFNDKVEKLDGERRRPAKGKDSKEKGATQGGSKSGKPDSSDLEEMQSLLSQLDAAQMEDRMRAGHERRSALALRAGQAVSSGMGGLKEENIPIPSGNLSRSGQVKDKISARESMLNNSKTRKQKDSDIAKTDTETELNQYKIKGNELSFDPESERSKAKRQLAEELGVKVNENMTEADLDEVLKEVGILSKEEMESARRKQREEHFTRAEGGKDRRVAAQITAGVGKTGMSAGASAGRGIAGKAAAEVYDQAEKDERDTGYDKVYHAGRDIKDFEANEMTKNTYHYGKLASKLDGLIKFMSVDPRAMAMWGTDKKTTLWSKYNDVLSAIVKANGDGVMNFGDKDHAESIVGRPQSVENLIASNALAAMMDYRQNIGKSMDVVAGGLGYLPGRAKKYDVNEKAAEAGGAATRSFRGDPESADKVNKAALDALKGKTPDLPKFQDPQKKLRQPDSGLVTVVDTKTGLEQTLSQDRANRYLSHPSKRWQRK